MTRTTIHRYITLMLLLLTAAGTMHAQTYAIRYVSSKNGTFDGAGTSWATAKNNLQNAIEELNSLIQGTATQGLIYVQGENSETGMRYVPTMRSTSEADGSVFNTSFRIYGGISVYGGFKGDEVPTAEYGEEQLWKLRVMDNVAILGDARDKTFAEVENDIDKDNIGGTVRRWNFKYKTVLSGNHSTNPTTFTYDTYRNIYATSFPLNSYHVVWFGTNGKIEPRQDFTEDDPNYEELVREKNLVGHYRGLDRPALVEGCTIEGGFASNTTLTGHVHTGYGGGVYMVKNATLRNCIVSHCAATMRGGAVYQDGGGELERCYIHTSQATGYGMQQGYGGAVCIDYDGAVRHSYIIQCAARIGAGLAICHVPDEYPEETVYPNEADRATPYTPYAMATLIANCTSNAEGAGVYLDEGGTLNHCTVVNNKCTGPDVIYYGRRHGRTGGIYVRNGGTIYNTVAWGNESAVNNDVQYASYKDQNSKKTIAVNHSAFSKQDLTDWSATARENIVSLANDNFPSAEYHEGNYPMFAQPTAKAGIQYNEETKAIDPTKTATGEPYQRVYNWHPLSASHLRMKAVQVSDALQGVAQEVLHAHTDVDVVGRRFEPVSSIGALARSYRNLTYALMPSQEAGESDLIPTIFMDPNRLVYGPKNTATSCGYEEDEEAGNSWTHSCGNLSDGITYLKNHLVEGGDEEHTYYDFDGTHYRHVQILVKQGSMVAAGQGAYINGQARTASLRPGSNMRLYGGFASELTGTDISLRSPHTYRTSFTANVMNGDYHNHAIHIIAIINSHNVIIDGFHIFSGNANAADPSKMVDASKNISYADLGYGGGIFVNNYSIDAAQRIDMRGNIVRNGVIANCSAPEGSAIFVSGGNKKSDGTFTKAELAVVNTVIRNNTAGPAHGDLHKFESEDSEWGTVVANGDAHIWLRNCNVMNNCGYALKANTPNESLPSDPTTNPRGHIEIYNSILFSNGKRMSADRSDISQAVSCKWEEDGAITGNYIFLDHDAVKPAMPEWIKCFNYLTRKKNEDHQTGTAYGHDEPVTLYYPWFVNPSRNVGHSEGEDYPMYGGVINYEPLATNPIVNGAYPDNMDSGNGFFDNPSDAFTEDNVLAKSRSMSYDRELAPRTYGGDPDAGAIECQRLPKGGSVLYVTQDGAGRMDGSSWANAIAGNLVYRVGDSYVVDPTNADKDGQYVTTKNNLYRGGYAVDYVYQTGTTTYVDRQTITQKRINLTFEADGSVTTEEGESTTLDERETTQAITKTNGLTRQPTDFIYGEKSGASRNFYRTNLKDDQIASAAQTNNNNGYTGLDLDNKSSITNNRHEDYVSGLQFAVEKAAALNKGTTRAEDRVQVWVGHGTYEDYKGFVMRDKVEVFGGFPTTKYQTPGMNERHALVSEYIPLSALNASLEDEKDQYETILQPIDQKPYGDDWRLVSDVMLYKDKDYTELGDKTITAESTVTIPVYYGREALPGGGYSEYHEVRGNNVAEDLTDLIVNPSFEQNGGTGNWSDSKAKNGWTISKGSISLKAGTGSYAAIHGANVQDNTGGYEVYQDIYNLEPGFYRVSCQGYNQQNAIGNISLFANGEQRVLVSNTGTAITNLNSCVNELAQGKYADNWVDVYVNNSGYLRIGLKGSYTGSGITTFDNFHLERLSGGEVASSTATTVKAEGYTEKAQSKEYDSYRKPVLSMPDVCMTTNWPGSIGGGDNPSNAVRWQKLSDGTYASLAGRGMEVYTDCHWDGFTIRHGFYNNYFANRDGGAGVRMFEGGTLENCVVVDNANCGAVRQRGGGGYCDGRTSKVIGCFFVNNLNSAINNAVATSSNDKDNNGGGIYMLVGTCYNSLFANNVCWGNDSRGAGIYIEQATFYNNTVAYNTCRKRDMTVYTSKGTGIHQYEGAQNGATLKVFNTLVYGNTGVAIGSQAPAKMEKFTNCYIQSNNAIDNTIVNNMVDCVLDNAGKDKSGKAYTAPNPFEHGDSAQKLNNYRLLSSSLCVNRGVIPADQEDTFPETDVDFAARVQDCQIDIGAYEFDGTIAIEPMLFPEEKEAVFYVTQNGMGMATATDPANAACFLKFQKVLDAAGRWRYASYFYDNTDELRKDETDYHYNLTNFTTAVLSKEIEQASARAVAAGNGAISTETELPNLRDYKVIVKLEGDNGTGFTYIPTRSSVTSDNENPNDLEMSLIVPHGIQIEGGYEYDFTRDRDPLGRPSTFSGEIQNTTLGTTGNVYHVVTFTNDLFDLNEKLYVNAVTGEKKQGQLTFLTDGDTYLSTGTEEEKAAWAQGNRTVLDGLFIEDGYANGTTDEEKRGAACVVTDYAHLRNCVIQNNRANGAGGGVYMEPGSLMSGCIVKNNQGYVGGGIYVVEPAIVDATTHVHVLTTTVVGNTATTTAGGLWFDSNLRANSSVFWRNTANDLNNIAGVINTDETQIVDNYPLNYCGVESRRVNGVNNIELPVAEDEGVRWNHAEGHELGLGSEILYYPITMSSVLSRAGMTYAAWEELCAVYPTLELEDIAGLKRMEQTVEGETITLANGTVIIKEVKANDFIEMGARVLNSSFELKVELQHIMTRLYVTTTEELPTAPALALQENPGTTDNDEMYRQMGSSFLNPFHRVGDALEYIIKVRKNTAWMDAEDHLKGTVADHYKDVRFEVFVSSGTFYPFRDAHGKQGEARANTFVVPEKVTIIGGMDPTDHNYCQKTEGDVTVAGYTLKGETTENMRAEREHLDRNGNHVEEPWEMRRQTILSGNTVNADLKTNVYHVITCFSDKNQVGELPTRTNSSGGVLSSLIEGFPSTGERLQNLEAESSTSRDARTIFIDGVTITGGWANDIEDDDKADNFQKLTYFRGGGIFVDGNWDNTFDDKVDLPEVLSVARRDIPMITTNCVFQDNLAGNGGGIYTNGTYYSFSCHYTKNTAQGPNTATDQQYIPWTAGGAIANNYNVHLWNCLFDNNEAKRGGMSITNGTITNADARQGYAGAISCSETGLLRVANCDFVRNKAVAYPALYNFIDNNLRAYSSQLKADGDEDNDHYYGAGHHFAVNTIFWGNQATANTIAPATSLEEEYYDRLYGDGGWQDLRKPYHVANFGPRMDIATLTFCAFEEGTGREGTVWHENHDFAKTAQIESLDALYAGDFADVLFEYFGFYQWDELQQKNVPYAKDDDPYRPKWPLTDSEKTDLLTNYIPYNYNLVLNSDNLAPDGPFFVQPSITAGADGYMETADWLVSRLNPTVDTGWGYLKQNVTQESEHSGLFSTTFMKGPDAEDLTPATDEDNQYTDLWGSGFYNLHAKNIHARFEDIGFPNLLPIGDEKYMTYVQEGATEGRNMRRISTHPKAGVQDVFIDMGIYEYQYVQLVTQGDEIDVIWVAETEDQSEVCDGSTWKKATSDLQNAIETLLLSLNDHDKMIKLRSGTYHPFKLTSSNQKAFFITMSDKNDGVMTPSGTHDADTELAVKSLTIRGGYSNDVTADGSDGEGTRNPEDYPTVLQMNREAGNTDRQLAHLFIIEDAEVKGNYMNFLTKTNKVYKDYVMPIVFDGLTFINPYGRPGETDEDGGSAIYYRSQYKTEYIGDNFYKDNEQRLKAFTDSAGNDVPKLLIKDCIFKGCGSDAGVSTLKIQKGGGPSLVVNSLFHSNSGAPIEAVNTQVVNSTFALNGGHITLTNETEEYHDGTTADYPSGLHNSIIWQDGLNEAAADRVQWDGTDLNLTDGTMTHNAYTRWNQSSGQWDEPNGTVTPDANGNILLSTKNGDVLLGPNFIDPKETLTGATAEEREEEMLQRDFHLNPSAHIFGQADADTYTAKVPYYAEVSSQNYLTLKDGDGVPIRDAEDNLIRYWFHSVQRYDASVLTEAMMKGTDTKHQERELAYKYRWLGIGLERGAYECTAAMQRVLYVMDGASGDKDGTSWEHAFEIDDLQKAVDVASVYSLTSSPQERAYVFVHASDYLGSALHLRDGVSVFGGVNIDQEVAHVGDQYLDEDIDDYIRMMRAKRNGVAARGNTHNVISGLSSDNDALPNFGFLIDGFWIQGGATEGATVDLTKDKTIVRNTVITGNQVSGSAQPVVNVERGLLYNTLVYGNTAGSGEPVVRVGTNGYALNNTIVATTGSPLAFTGSHVETSVHLQNNIALTEASGTRQTPFAPYMRPLAQGGNTGLTNTLPTYLTAYQPYWYQLHEQSQEIDAGTDDGSGADGNNSIARLFPDYVDFRLDCDVLGNPRRLRGRVDNGCFETWRITGSKFVTNATNEAYTQNYGGHLYPHQGSVVYLDQHANMVVSTDEGAPLFTSDHPLQPGYVLVKTGASVYGQGNTLRFGYVAAEKSFADSQYGLMAFPFAHYASDAYTVSHYDESDLLVQTPLPLTAYTYDGEKRSKYEYTGTSADAVLEYSFHDNNSTCWSETTSLMAPTDGWLLKFDAPQTAEVRFTGWGANEGDYVYTEDGTDTKTVTLRQYNSHQTGAAAYPLFTRMEHMGWNLKGQPWLVGRFVTGGTNPDFQMDVPHLFYSMQGDGTYSKAAGQMYTTRSWDDGADIRLGDGVFTQTAIIGTEELLTFKRPVFSDEAVAPARMLVAVTRRNVSGSNGANEPDEFRNCFSDYVELHPQEGADAAMPYKLGSDGIKWFGYGVEAPGLFVVNEAETPLSLVSSAPIGVDIRLGLLTHADGDELTIGLPDAEAFAAYDHVWLTDHLLNRVTDLKDSDYTLTVDEAACYTNRLTLRIGGVLPADEPGAADEASYRIYTRRNRLFIEGLQPGDHILVYNAGGALVENCRATNETYQRDLYSGTYIVRVNNVVKKVLAHR